jgi:hypothetical protein
MSGAIPPLPQYVFMAWCLVKHRDNFTCHGRRHLTWSSIQWARFKVFTEMVMKFQVVMTCIDVVGYRRFGKMEASRSSATMASYHINTRRHNPEDHDLNSIQGVPPLVWTTKLTPCSRVLEKLTVAYLVKKFPAFYGTRRFITAFTRARPWSLPWVRLIQSTSSHPTTLGFILI